MKTRCRRIAAWVALSVALCLILGACAQTRGYQPMANPQADPRAAYYDQDLEYCKGQASQTAQTGTQAAQGALAGGAIGAAGELSLVPCQRMSLWGKVPVWAPPLAP
jgi:hypothetical protein